MRNEKGLSKSEVESQMELEKQKEFQRRLNYANLRSEIAHLLHKAKKQRKREVKRKLKALRRKTIKENKEAVSNYKERMRRLRKCLDECK